MIIAVDIDEVLADTLTNFLNFYNNKNGTNIKPEDFATYDYWRELHHSKKEMIELWEEYRELGGFRNTPLFPEAVNYVPELAKNNKLVVITGRAQVLYDDTKYWLDKHFPGIFSKVYHLALEHYEPPIKTKFEICKEIGAKVLIDDLSEYGEDCARNGIKFIIFDKPWNRKSELLPNIVRVKSWREVISEVDKIAIS